MPQILKIGFLVSFSLLILFLIRKKKAKPTKLSWKKSSSENKNKYVKLKGFRKVKAEVVGARGEEKSGEVFLYNGKKYVVWNVLNLPSGAGGLELKQALAYKIKEDPSRKVLYTKAYKIAKNL